MAATDPRPLGTANGGQEIDPGRPPEQVRLESEERFARVFEISPMAMSITRLADAIYLDVNDSYVRLLGYPRHELVGHCLLNLDLWVDRAQRLELIRGAEAEGAVLNVEVQLRTRTGALLDALASFAPVHLDGQACMFGIFYDVTDRKKNQRELAQRIHDLERFNRAAVGRELRMVELKRQVNELALELGRPAPYDLSQLLAEPDNRDRAPGHGEQP